MECGMNSVSAADGSGYNFGGWSIGTAIYNSALSIPLEIVIMKGFWFQWRGERQWAR